jgi:hypothetical protein
MAVLLGSANTPILQRQRSGLAGAFVALALLDDVLRKEEF